MFPPSWLSCRLTQITFARFEVISAVLLKTFVVLFSVAAEIVPGVSSTKSLPLENQGVEEELLLG